MSRRRLQRSMDPDQRARFAAMRDEHGMIRSDLTQLERVEMLLILELQSGIAIPGSDRDRHVDALLSRMGVLDVAAFRRVVVPPAAPDEPTEEATP